MFRLPTTLLSLLLSLPAMSQEVINLWPNGAIPNAIAGVAAQEKTETGSDGILRISNVVTPTLTVYLPTQKQRSGAEPNAAGPRSAVMICPGGGYWILAAGHEGADVAKWFNEQNVVAFVLKYRLPDEKLQTNPHEVPLLDAMQGMRLIRQNAARYGIDPNRVGVMGFSAGGHLASTLSTHWHKTPNNEAARPNFALLLYPVITFGDKAHTGSRDKLLGRLNTSAELIAAYSNEQQVTPQTPPTFLVHSMDDKGVPVENSISYYVACLKQGVPTEMHLYPTGGHGYALRTAGKGSVAAWPDACRAWLRSLNVVN